MKPHWWLIHAHVRQDRIARKLNEAMEGSVYSRTNTVEDENSDGVFGEVPTLRFEVCVMFVQCDALGSKISTAANFAGVKGQSFGTIDATIGGSPNLRERCISRSARSPSH